MLWYRNISPKLFKQTIKRRSFKFNVRVRSLAFLSPKYISRSVRPNRLYIPSNWKILVLSNRSELKNYNILYLYNPYYYFKVILPSQNTTFNFDNYSRTLVTYSLWKFNFFDFYFNSLTSLFTVFTQIFFKKLKIKGKGYYIYKNYRNTLTHQLGHSHRIYIYSYFTYVKFLSKTSVLFFGLSKNDLISQGSLLRASKYINIFTGRGVRFSRQVIYKKTGKVSSYR